MPANLRSMIKRLMARKIYPLLLPTGRFLAKDIGFGSREMNLLHNMDLVTPAGYDSDHRTIWIHTSKYDDLARGKT